MDKIDWLWFVGFVMVVSGLIAFTPIATMIVSICKLVFFIALIAFVALFVKRFVQGKKGGDSSGS
jgi:flagellar biogenesis protein FliO